MKIIKVRSEEFLHKYRVQEGENKLGKAIAIAVDVFGGVLDKGGKPYIMHCLWVMNKVRHQGEDAMIVALLHDVFEDSDLTFNDLIMFGFNQKVTLAIMRITHEKNIPYFDYIEIISNNRLATIVKIRDLEHNMKPTRLKGFEQKDFDRTTKYQRSYFKLNKIRTFIEN